MSGPDTCCACEWECYRGEGDERLWRDGERDRTAASEPVVGRIDRPGRRGESSRSRGDRHCQRTSNGTGDSRATMTATSGRSGAGDACNDRGNGECRLAGTTLAGTEPLRLDGPGGPQAKKLCVAEEERQGEGDVQQLNFLHYLSVISIKSTVCINCMKFM